MSEYEPAAPPTGGSGPSGPRASFGRRFVAWLIDYVLLAIPYVILILVIDNAAAAYGLYLLIAVAYFGYFEGGATGQTLGKRALGIRVVDFNAGGAIGFGRGVIRYIGKIIASIPLCLGFFWMLWDREKQCWQDKIATTVVVPVSAYPVA
jgi:uncharacterized RDD family membrane protein YckC